MALAARHRSADAGLGDRFTDLRLLRAGSRFTIYAARERESGRRVAVKVPGEAGGSWLDELLDAEGEVLVALRSHPHVITCHERFVLPDGRPALVLEHCARTLHDAVGTDGSAALPDAVAVGIKLSGALETAHRFGVLHCDVRPQHVLLTAAVEPVLTGFDAAVRIDATRSRPPLPQFTPHTAPELLEGAQPTTASDVYGLAATLYQLVAGRAAFREYEGESPASVVVRVMTGPVLPISATNAPLELSDLLTWALAPDPADRPPSPAWIAEELGRIAQQQGWPRPSMIVR